MFPEEICSDEKERKVTIGIVNELNGNEIGNEIQAKEYNIITANEITKCDNSEKESRNSCYKYFLRPLKNYFWSDSLLKDKRFLAMLLSTFICFLSFLIPSSFTADHAVELGMSKVEASWLTSTIGITNALGRILFGIIGDRSCVNRSKMLLAVLVLSGIASVLSFLLTTFITRLIYTCTYGLLIGGYFTMISVVIAETFGAERVAKSFGVLLFTIGVGATVSLPIGGLLYDKTGSYDVTFIVAGVELVAAGIILLIALYNRRTSDNIAYHLSDVTRKPPF